MLIPLSARIWMTLTVNDESTSQANGQWHGVLSARGFVCVRQTTTRDPKKESNAKEKASPPPTYSLLIATPCCALQSSSNLGNKISSVSVCHLAGAKNILQSSTTSSCSIPLLHAARKSRETETLFGSTRNHARLVCRIAVRYLTFLPPLLPLGNWCLPPNRR